jgi:hypothetical protein
VYVCELICEFKLSEENHLAEEKTKKSHTESQNAERPN